MTELIGSVGAFELVGTKKSEKLDGAVESRDVYGVTFHNIDYELISCCSTRSKKTILHGLSGQLLQGVNAIMGPTGSGKTR